MRFQRIAAYDKASNRLDSKARARLDNKLAQFERDVLAGVNPRELARSYEFKQLERLPPQGKTELRGEIYQLRPLNDYRVIILLVTDQGDSYYVHTWRKSGNSDPDQVSKGKSRALNLLKSLANNAQEYGVPGGESAKQIELDRDCGG